MVDTGSFEQVFWPPEVLNQIWITTLVGAPFTQSLTQLSSDTGSVAFPTAAPSGAAFIRELDPIPEAVMGDGALIVKCQKAAVIEKLSNESLADSSLDVALLASNAIRADLGAIVEHELLYGTGADPNPDGVMNHATAAAAGADFRAAAINAWAELAAAGSIVTSIVVFAEPDRGR